jgi:tRNA(Ile)-lysidine synthase
VVDHGLRPGSRVEADAAVAACAGLGLPAQRLDWAGAPGPRLQERARDARYRLLAQAARQAGGATIVLAHHADDQAETILFRLLRGSGPAGLAGMASIAPCPGAPELRLARPFLDVPKARLVAFAAARGLSPCDDPSNRDPRFARARLRPLLALLAEEGGDAERFARLAHRMRRADGALEEAADAAGAALALGGGENGLDGRGWSRLPEELRLRLLARAFAAAGAVRPRLDRLEALEARLSAAARAGRAVRASLAGAMAVLEHGRLLVTPAPARRPPSGLGGRRLGKPSRDA